MEIIIAQNTPEEFVAFQKLEAEFDELYTSLGVGTQYDRKQRASEDRAEYDDYLKGGYFVFAKEGDEYGGYLSGAIKDMPRGYDMKKVGDLDSLIVAKKHQNQGIGPALQEKFFEWLKSKGITICQLNVKSENTHAIETYMKWGFQVDQVRMWKKI